MGNWLLNFILLASWLLDYWAASNPASREFTVTGLASGAPFQLYSISGQQHTVPTQRFDAQQVLDISALPSGLYFLKSDGRVLRFLKE